MDQKVALLQDKVLSISQKVERLEEQLRLAVKEFHKEALSPKAILAYEKAFLDIDARLNALDERVTAMEGEDA